MGLQALQLLWGLLEVTLFLWFFQVLFRELGSLPKLSSSTQAQENGIFPPGLPFSSAEVLWHGPVRGTSWPGSQAALETGLNREPGLHITLQLPHCSCF